MTWEILFGYSRCTQSSARRAKRAAAAASRDGSASDWAVATIRVLGAFTKVAVCALVPRMPSTAAVSTRRAKVKCMLPPVRAILGHRHGHDTERSYSGHIGRAVSSPAQPTEESP